MKIIKTGQSARDALKRGIDLVADCVKVTLGPSGRNAVIGRQDITPIITNDGVTIAHSIEAEDEIEQNGVLMVKEATYLADNEAGDGTTTTTVLLQAIVNELFNKIQDNGSLVASKVNLIDLKKKLDEECAIVCEKLEKQATTISNEDLYNVALASGEFTWVAEMVADIFKQIGKDGFVTVEEARKTSYEVFKGIELDSGFLSEYFINNDKRECVIDNPRILVANKQLELHHVIPLVEGMATAELSDLILVAPDFTEDLLKRLNATRLKSGMSIVAIKQGLIRSDILTDVAVVTGAKLIDKGVFLTDEQFVKEMKLDNCGTAKRAIISADKTIILGGVGDTSERIKELRLGWDKSDSQFDKNILEKRIAYLSGGLAVVKIGAETEFEKTYFKLKLEDAINAVQSAMTHGVVKGGGLALFEIAGTLPDDSLLKEAIKRPYIQIQENAGSKIEIPDTVIDSVKTTTTALKSACSIAGLLITTEVAVAYKKEKNNDKSKGQVEN